MDPEASNLPSAPARARAPRSWPDWQRVATACAMRSDLRAPVVYTVTDLDINLSLINRNSINQRSVSTRYLSKSASKKVCVPKQMVHPGDAAAGGLCGRVIGARKVVPRIPKH